MPKTVVVGPGDCVASLCDAHGVTDYHRIYDDGANAAVKGDRPNPNVLAAGDELSIPDPTPKVFSLATHQEHRFKLERVEVTLKIALVDQTGAGIAGLLYELTVGAVTEKGTTGSDGVIEHKIPAIEKTGTLQLKLKDEPGLDGYLFALELGALEHESVDRACQARLLNLGFDCGGVGGTVDQATHDALRGFQKKASLTVNGALDARTRDRLRVEHEGA